MMVFSGASASDAFVNTGSVITSTRGEGAVFSVICTGSTITNVLVTAMLPFPTIEGSGKFIIFWMVDVFSDAANATVAFLKSCYW